jgi:hypothetical protein
MSAKDKIKAELNDLINEGRKLPRQINKDTSLIDIGRSYQSWYTKAIKLVSVLAPDRIAEFRSYYEVDPKRKSIDLTTYKIRDYVIGLFPKEDIYGTPQWDHRALVQLNIANQLFILESLESRIDGVLADLEGALLAGLQNAELTTAMTLKKVNVRAAGALAGVVLEDHLQRVAANHGVKIAKKNPTISDLNDPLWQAGIYDQPTWRKISYLADIRNLCSHQKGQDPTPQQVDELINGVNWAIKNVI